LLRHTSGLTYQWNSDLGPMYKDANVASGILPYDDTIDDCVQRLAKVPLLFNPGERWEYSLSIDVLARLIEVVSGMPLDEFFRTRIFEPLDMKDTFFFPPDNKVGRLAIAYTYYPDKGLNPFPDTPITEDSLTYSADYHVRRPNKLFSGGAGLNSSAPDYARICEMILNGGKLGSARMLSPKSVELMTHDQSGKISPKQGFGLASVSTVLNPPLEELGTPGQFVWRGFFYTEFSIDRKEDMIVIFMGQLHPAGVAVEPPSPRAGLSGHYKLT
jgi:CubicO group peptidase (beta-lactamase class C family)